MRSINSLGGLIFLGDGGAYLLGFLLADLTVLLVHRNPNVSPVFPLLLCAYPIFETVFAIYRRKVVRGVATTDPDGIHLHTLIHRDQMDPGRKPRAQKAKPAQFNDFAVPVDAVSVRCTAP